jgi:iron-sulfur cluster repair protein YtfE (RIC family)
MNDEEKRFLEQIQKQNEDAHAETRRQVQAIAAEVAQAQKQSQDAHAETRRQFAEFAQAIQQRFDTKTEELEQRFDEVSRVTRRHFDTVAEDMRGDIKFLAESLAHVDQKVDANNAKIDSLAADNEIFRAAIGNLDRRLRVVEDIVLPQSS